MNLTLDVKICRLVNLFDTVVVTTGEQITTMASVKVAVRVRPINKRYSLWDFVTCQVVGLHCHLALSQLVR